MPLTLVLGPANSAKAGEVLGAYGAAARRGALLVVPTALDAEHYSRELAAEGAVIGSVLTFAGLAGMGDLVATCYSPLSRNRTVGEQLGKGRTLEAIVSEMKMVAEGVKTSRPLCALAHAHGLEVPISEQVVRVLYEGVAPTDLVRSLMLREAKPELHGLEG